MASIAAVKPPSTRTLRALLYTLTTNAVAAGTIVQRFNFDVGFIFLATVAAAAFGILYFFMPETRDNPNQQSASGYASTG